MFKLISSLNNSDIFGINVYEFIIPNLNELRRCKQHYCLKRSKGYTVCYDDVAGIPGLFVLKQKWLEISFRKITLQIVFIKISLFLIFEAFLRKMYIQDFYHGTDIFSFSLVPFGISIFPKYSLKDMLCFEVPWFPEKEVNTARNRLMAFLPLLCVAILTLQRQFQKLLGETETQKAI